MVHCGAYVGVLTVTAGFEPDTPGPACGQTGYPDCITWGAGLQ